MKYPNIRLYPHLVPSFEGEPLRDRLKLEMRGAIGEALVAVKDVPVDEVLFRFAGVTLPHQTLFTLQLTPGSYIHDPWVMGKVIHSCDPNTVCDMETRTFTTVKPIKAGEMITMDYESTEDYLSRAFTCHCGSPKCRKIIRGRLA